MQSPVDTPAADPASATAPVMLGVSHRSAAVEIRGRLAIPADDRNAALESLGGVAGVRECAILATCNRTEIYAVTDAGDPAPVLRWFCDWHGLTENEVEPYLDSRSGAGAVAHLIRVAAGLESAVVGETQIVGQIKEAFGAAREGQYSGSMLGRLTDHALAVAKEIRSDTGIGRCPVSVAGVAVAAVGRLLEDLSRARVLVVGAGENAVLAIRHLRAKGCENLLVANRTLYRAQQVADSFAARAYPLTALASLIGQVDVVVATSGAPGVLIDAAMVAEARRHANNQRPLLLIDLAVPQDIATDVADLPGVHLYSADALAALSRANLAAREEAAREAHQRVEAGTTRFMEWVSARNAVPTVRAIRQRVADMRDQALEKARRELQRGKDPDQVLAYLAHHLTQRILHEPSTELRSAKGTRQQSLRSAAESLFGVESR